jgi:protein-L-isoaspartate(D-aspartate) O-methyltransferase
VERLEAHRLFFARLITANAGVPAPGGRLAAAFASTPRERFVGSGPWKIPTAIGYVETPTGDPALLYQDFPVSLKEEGAINTGSPTLHALCLSTLDPKEGETALHIGAGTGYYTAVLARLVGAAGSVRAYEIEPDLAQRAAGCLADLPQVTVHTRSGSEGPLPECDLLYVNAGASAPLDAWLDALRPGGRLLFPLMPAQGAGGMLLITRGPGDRYEARFLCHAYFFPCAGAYDEETAGKLSQAFRRNDAVRSLHRGTPPDETCWCSGRGWWLSTAPTGG